MTTRDIAERAGVNQSTVSRALRNDPSVAESTRKKIHAIAEELKYRPNPFVSAFTAQVRGYRRSPQNALIAILNPHSGEMPRSHRSYAQGAKERAERLGFKADLFHYHELGAKESRLLQVLHARGIKGLLILPLPISEDLSGLNVANLACATIDISSHVPNISHAVPDYFRQMQTVLDRLTACGYRRIGFCTKARELVGFAQYSCAAYLLWQQQTTAPRLPVHIAENAGPNYPEHRDSFYKWLGKAKPDVIVSNEHQFLQWMRGAGLDVPGEIGFASLCADPKNRAIAGVDQCRKTVGAAAMDVIIAHIYRNEYGLPESMKTVFINGVWQDGESILNQHH